MNNASKSKVLIVWLRNNRTNPVAFYVILQGQIFSAVDKTRYDIGVTTFDSDFEAVFFWAKLCVRYQALIQTDYKKRFVGVVL